MKPVFILTPVFSEVQMKDTVDKYVGLLKELGAEINQCGELGPEKIGIPYFRRKPLVFMYWLNTRLIYCHQEI